MTLGTVRKEVELCSWLLLQCWLPFNLSHQQGLALQQSWEHAMT